MAGVIIGVDPHKLSATIEVVDHHRHLLGSGRFTTAAIVQLRHDTEGRAYYRRLVADARATEEPAVDTGPGGHCGATQESSLVDLPPHIDTSDQPLPGPAAPTLRPTATARKSSDRRALGPVS